MKIKFFVHYSIKDFIAKYLRQSNIVGNCRGLKLYRDQNGRNG